LYDESLVSYLGGVEGCVERIVESASEAFAGREPTLSLFNPMAMYNPLHVAGINWEILNTVV